MKSNSFNLVDKKWIPCLMLNGEPNELGLLETLSKAHEIREIFDPSPLVTAALYRLLLAVLHRNFGPASVEEWKAIWETGHFDKSTLQDYFNNWYNRFDLFDKVHPFYQTARFGKGKMKTVEVNDLLPEMARGNNPTLFDHTFDDSSVPLGPAVAARNLLALQSFKLGGLSGLRSNFVDAPSARSVLFMIRGENLFQTLMLNLVKYDEDEPIPGSGSGEDRPVWEQDQPLNSPIPKGYLDYLTWQTLLLRLVTDSNGLRIVGCEMALGRNLKSDGNPFDPTVAYQRDKKSGWKSLRFQEDKALWRDSTTLFNFATVEDDAPGDKPPETMRWIRRLIKKGVADKSTMYQVDAYGLCTKPGQDKVFFWRHERLPLPLVYLADKNLVEDLQSALDEAGKVGDILMQALKQLVIGILPSTGNKVDGNSVNDIVKHLGDDKLFWSRLEIPFYQLLQDLPREREMALDPWTNTLRRTCWDCFEKATRDLDGSTRTLRSIVEARQRLGGGLKRVRT